MNHYIRLIDVLQVDIARNSYAQVEIEIILHVEIKREFNVVSQSLHYGRYDFSEFDFALFQTDIYSYFDVERNVFGEGIDILVSGVFCNTRGYYVIFSCKAYSEAAERNAHLHGVDTEIDFDNIRFIFGYLSIDFNLTVVFVKFEVDAFDTRYYAE